MCNMGMNVLLTPNHADIIHMKTGTLMICGYWDGNLYKLQIDVQKPEHAKATQKIPLSKASLGLWHCQLSHISEETIRKMARDNLVEGMTLAGSGMPDCSACQKGKQMR